MATWLQRSCVSHRSKACRSSVVVENVRHSRFTWRPDWIRTQATIVALCTSRPATRSCITSITPPPSWCRRRGGARGEGKKKGEKKEGGGGGPPPRGGGGPPGPPGPNSQPGSRHQGVI